MEEDREVGTVEMDRASADDAMELFVGYFLSDERRGRAVAPDEEAAVTLDADDDATDDARCMRFALRLRPAAARGRVVGGDWDVWGEWGCKAVSRGT